MNYRLAKLLDNKTMGASGTEIIDIDLLDPISAIVINQRSTNDGNTPDEHAVKVISKIEVVDGSDVLYSLSGYEAEAMDFYGTGICRCRFLPYVDNTQLVIPYFVDFGRFLYDRELALDPTKFTNPQVKITYDRDAGGDGCDALELEVMAHIFDDRKIAPVGFLMSKELKSWALADATWEYTDLPTDHPYRNILILSRAAQKHPHAQFREIKLTEDVDKKIPYHELTMDLIKYNQYKFDRYEEEIAGYFASATTITYFITPAYSPKMGIIAGTTGTNAYFASDRESGGQCRISAHTATHMRARIIGWCPHGAVCLPCNGNDDLDDMYDVTKLGSLKIEIKGGTSVGSGSTAELCVQQVRKY